MVLSYRCAADQAASFSHIQLGRPSTGLGELVGCERPRISRSADWLGYAWLGTQRPQVPLLVVPVRLEDVLSLTVRGLRPGRAICSPVSTEVVETECRVVIAV